MRLARVALMAVALAATHAHVGHADTSIIGTGSAFAQPIYSKWADEAAKSTGVRIDYQSSGSAIGQKQVANGLTDFGASDVPMEEERLRKADLLQFPTVVGGYAIIVNLPNIASGQLRLTGSVLADIFLGRIKRWDDARVASLNPGVELPKLDVLPLYHAGGSGGTYALSRYLAKVSETWRTKIGVGMALKWSVGAGVKGSYGASIGVPGTSGSIAYAEFSYVAANHLATVQMQNKAGRFVGPSVEAFAAASDRADWTAKNFAVDLTDMPGEQSWPIVTATFILAPKSPGKAAKTTALLNFFGWAFAHGDETARSLHYVPLSSRVKADIAGSWPK